MVPFNLQTQLGLMIDLDVIDITGNLNLDAAISNTTSLSVSSTSNLGADVTTTGDQTYSGAAVLSSNVILTTTANGECLLWFNIRWWI